MEPTQAIISELRTALIRAGTGRRGVSAFDRLRGDEHAAQRFASSELANLDTDYNLHAVIGSWHDTMTPEWVLDALRDLNSGRTTPESRALRAEPRPATAAIARGTGPSASFRGSRDRRGRLAADR